MCCVPTRSGRGRGAALAPAGAERLYSLLIRRGCDAVDANAGDGAAAKRLAGVALTVHAFETHPGKVQALKRTMPANVAVHSEVLTARSGKEIVDIDLSDGTLPQGGPVTGHMTIRLPTARLDDLIDAPIDLVRMVAAGRQLDVLEGGRALIAKRRPHFLVRSDAPAVASELFALFLGLGYTGVLCAAGCIAGFDEAPRQVSHAVFSPAERQCTPRRLRSALVACDKDAGSTRL